MFDVDGASTARGVLSERSSILTHISTPVTVVQYVNSDISLLGSC